MIFGRWLLVGGIIVLGFLLLIVHTQIHLLLVLTEVLTRGQSVANDHLLLASRTVQYSAVYLTQKFFLTR